MKALLRDVYTPIMSDLIKIYYYRDYSKDVEEWIVNLYNKLCSVPSIGLFGRYPKEKFLKKYLWYSIPENTPGVDVAIHMKDVLDLNKYFSEKYCEVSADDTCILFCKEYIMWLCGALAEKGFTTQSAIRSEVKYLLTKHGGYF